MKFENLSLILKHEMSIHERLLFEPCHHLLCTIAKPEVTAFRTGVVALGKNCIVVLVDVYVLIPQKIDSNKKKTFIHE